MFTSSLLQLLAAASVFSSLSAAAPTTEPDWLLTSLEINEDASRAPVKDVLSFKLQRPGNQAPDSCTMQWTRNSLPAVWQNCGDDKGFKKLSYMINTYGMIDGRTTLDITIKEWFIA
jgi:hypothetical protein